MKNKIKFIYFVAPIVLLMTFTLSIVCAAFNQTMLISGDAYARVNKDIRIKFINYESSTNGGTISYKSRYTKTTITSGFVLPNSNSTISYTVHVDNVGDVDYAIYDILTTSSNNQGLTYTISGYDMRDVIQAGTSVDLIITYRTTNPGDGIINVINTFDFREVYYISYETNSTDVIPTQIKYENVDIALTSAVPTKDGYLFNSWNTIYDGTGTSFSSESTYSLNEDKVLYAIYDSITYNITYNLNNGTVTTPNPASYTPDTPTFTLNNPTKTITFRGNYNSTIGANASSSDGVTIGSDTTQEQTFRGWSGTGLSGYDNTSVSVDQGSTGNRTYTANWTAVTTSTPTVTRTGYYTCGWNRSSTGTTIEFYSESNYATSVIYSYIEPIVNLYAVCRPNSYNIKYTLNGGQYGNKRPSKGNCYSDVIIDNPTKTFTLTIDKNGTDATVETSVQTTQTFAGWTSSSIGNDAQTKSSETGTYSAWNGTAKTTNTYFNNLKEIENGTVYMVANWNAANITLPSITKDGYKCSYNTNKTGTGTTYNPGQSYSTSTTNSASKLYVICGQIFKVGEYFTLVPDSATATTTTSGFSGSTPTADQTLWRVIKQNDDGSCDAVSEYVSTNNITISGTNGYKYYVSGLKTLASKYKKSGYTTSTRMMGYNSQTATITSTNTKYFNGTTTTMPSNPLTSGNPTTGTGGTEYNGGALGDTKYLNDYGLVSNVYNTNTSTYGSTGLKAYTKSGTVKNYWISSRYYNKATLTSTTITFAGRSINTDGSLAKNNLRTYTSSNRTWSDGSASLSIRPIITLKFGVTVASGAGTKANPYVFN